MMIQVASNHHRHLNLAAPILGFATLSSAYVTPTSYPNRNPRSSITTDEGFDFVKESPPVSVKRGAARVPRYSVAMPQTDAALSYFPPMGVYETLFKFLDATGKYMGSEGTHPWAQGFPLTSPIPGGPEIPTRIDFTYQDLKYPQATGGQELLAAVRDYYNHFYGAKITTENIAIFAGGRPGIYASLAFLKPEWRVFVEETEYTPYWDALKLLNRAFTVIPS